MAAIKELNIGFCEGSRAFPRLAFLCPGKNILKNTCAVLRCVLHLCIIKSKKINKMKRIFTIDFMVRAIIFVAILLIIITAFTHSWYSR